MLAAKATSPPTPIEGERNALHVAPDTLATGSPVTFTTLSPPPTVIAVVAVFVSPAASVAVNVTVVVPMPSIVPPGGDCAIDFTKLLSVAVTCAT